MSSANGILLVSPALDEVRSHLDGRAWDEMDARAHGILQELESILQPTFFGPGAECVLVHSLEQIGARLALQVVEMAAQYPETYWVFHVGELNSPKRQKKFEKVLLERFPKKALRPPTASQLKEECLKIAARQGIEIEPSVVELLVQCLGADRKLLTLELEKLSHLGRPVVQQDILLTYAPQGNRDAFSLVRRVFHGEKAGVLQDIRTMEAFEDVFQVANAFVYEMSKVYLIKLWGPKASFGNTGVSDYFVGQYRQVCQNLSFEGACELMQMAARTDYELKTTSLGYEQVYQLVEKIDRLMQGTTRS